ncbi:PREDICTED: uncharacterized protein LOC101305293 [Fragaria vesca subsp. vesca]|uniref:uncharacterized protein LOC101305293 n=1 Tax=Fragaria vesca subsp. vesca TaxID=101020 RepID=UPI0002C2FB43|nr:PREDICTED: uncharacterized protein LOC101305293 [Fragaria vesca subsp. vesca]XP_011457697.1 PREDICTED: uncharacterized protein LOC101305293 [Fragaria vesca subsp. vesca]
MGIEIPVISDVDPSHSPTAKKRRLGEFDVEELIQIQRIYDSEPKDAVPDARKCGGPAKPSREQLKKINEVVFRKFFEGNEIDDEDSGEEMKPCEIGMKEEDLPNDCPYLQCIPNPKDTHVGKDETDDEDSDKVMKPCDVCMEEHPDHLPNLCPYLECIPNPKDTHVGKDETNDEDSDEEMIPPCEVCLKENPDHFSNGCPYLERVPNPKDTAVGKAFMIVCIHCFLEKHGHPDGAWQGCAMLDPRFFYDREPADDEPPLKDESEYFAWLKVGVSHFSRV